MIAWERIRRRVLAILLPKRCVFCDTVIPPVHVCCAACVKQISVIEPPLCPHCGQNKKQCGCEKHRLAFDKVAAPFYYESAVRDGILRLKRCDDPDAVDYFAERMQTVVLREYGNKPIDSLTYVPMTARGLRAREYNQGQLLARALGKRLGLPVRTTLVKLYETPPQKEKDLHDRSGNVLGVFEVIDQTVRGKTLLLVDDVMTTGATLHECAKMLKIYGAKQVLAVTVAVRRLKP